MMIKLSKKKKKRKEGLTLQGRNMAGRSFESPHTRVITEWRVGP